MAQAGKYPGYEHIQQAVNGAEFIFGAEAANARTVDIQLAQWNLDAPAQSVVDIYLSSDADGGTPVSADGLAVRAEGGALLATFTANRAIRVVSNDDGEVDLTVTEATASTNLYVNVVLPSGYVITSPVLAFA